MYDRSDINGIIKYFTNIINLRNSNINTKEKKIRLIIS